MKTNVWIIATLLVGGFISSCNQKVETNWYRGNTHAHSTLSDGDTVIGAAVRWYNDHGYHFLLMSDHNTTSYPENSDSLTLREDFILIPANEITGEVHFTAMNVTKPMTYREIIDKAKEEITDSLTHRRIVTIVSKAITDAGGIAFVNHPNFASGVQAEDMMDTENTITHIELFNGHPYVYNWGKEGHEAVETKWDKMLTGGKFVYAVASDDTHHYKEMQRMKANPGRGWVMVKADTLSREAITQAIANGEFYASTGVWFDLCEIDNKSLAVSVDMDKTKAEIANGFLFANEDSTGVEGLLIETIGKEGSVLSSSTVNQTNGISPIHKYRISSDDLYARIRATYCVKEGDVYKKYYAWTQPLMNK